MMITQLEQREVFHLLFLKQLISRLKPNSYAVKGGVNLRFFFGSPRYSEDMDIDVEAIEIFRLKEIVLGILLSKVMQTVLKPFSIEKIIPPDMSAAKQTDTTQRFKAHLITSSGENLFTKIEFSKRGLKGSFAPEGILGTLASRYKLPPMIASHYLIDSAATQKIGALAGRAETQARDIFDLYLLLPRLAGFSKIVENISPTIRKRAHENVFTINFNMFRDSVLNYLNEEDRREYEDNRVWEDIQLKVSEWLK